VVHWTYEAARTALLLVVFAALISVVAGLVRFVVPVSAGLGVVAGILLRRRTAVPITELLFPALTSTGALLLLAAVEVLLATLRLELLGLRRGLHWGDLSPRLATWLILEALRLPGPGVEALVLPLPATAAAALGLPHAVGDWLTAVLRLSVLRVGRLRTLV